jgi:hypothetical protein
VVHGFDASKKDAIGALRMYSQCVDTIVALHSVVLIKKIHLGTRKKAQSVDQ